MFKFIKGFENKQFFNIKGLGVWLNSSIKNRAIFVYSMATFSILIRYCLYSLHHGSWLVDSVTFYSALFSYTIASVFLFLFGVLKNVTFGDYVRKFIDIDRIRENRIRAEKFRGLVVETHNAQKYFKIYSYDAGLTFGISLMLLTKSSGTSFACVVTPLVIIYNLWWLYNVLYFAKCMNATPVPDELKTIKPAWLRGLEDYNKNLVLMNGVGTAAGESVVGSGLSKKVIGKVSKATSRSVNYLTDITNLPTILKVTAGVGTAIFTLDDASANASHKTSYLSRAFEVNDNGTYSPDPDTRSKAAALRRRGVDLLDCCEPNSKCLNSELVENKYELVRPYESKRYLALEEKATALEEKATALEEENRKLRLNLEDPGLK